jgi:hypothetical protein
MARFVYIAICFFDLSSYLAENTFCRRCKNQSRRDNLDVTILRKETGSSRRETCPGFTSSPTDLTWTDLGSKSNFYSERQATNYLNQDTASAPYAIWLTRCCQRDKEAKTGNLSKKLCAFQNHRALDGKGLALCCQYSSGCSHVFVEVIMLKGYWLRSQSMGNYQQENKV